MARRRVSSGEGWDAERPGGAFPRRAWERAFLMRIALKKTSSRLEPEGRNRGIYASRLALRRGSSAEGDAERPGGAFPRRAWERALRGGSRHPCPAPSVPRAIRAPRHPRHALRTTHFRKHWTSVLKNEKFRASVAGDARHGARASFRRIVSILPPDTEGVL
jgi:hypothetical protein